jgi:segregation and condensation protein A
MASPDRGRRDHAAAGPTVGTGHLHHRVSVPEQARGCWDARRAGVGQWASFTELVADCQVPIEIVGPFPGAARTVPGRAVAFEQPEPLGVLQVSWTGGSPTDDQLHEPEE